MVIAVLNDRAKLVAGRVVDVPRSTLPAVVGGRVPWGTLAALGPIPRVRAVAVATNVGVPRDVVRMARAVVLLRAAQVARRVQPFVTSSTRGTVVGSVEGHGTLSARCTVPLMVAVALAVGEQTRHSTGLGMGVAVQGACAGAITHGVRWSTAVVWGTFTAVLTRVVSHRATGATRCGAYPLIAAAASTAGVGVS